MYSGTDYYYDAVDVTVTPKGTNVLVYDGSVVYGDKSSGTAGAEVCIEVGG